MVASYAIRVKPGKGYLHAKGRKSYFAGSFGNKRTAKRMRKNVRKEINEMNPKWLKGTKVYIVKEKRPQFFKKVKSPLGIKLRIRVRQRKRTQIKIR